MGTDSVGFRGTFRGGGDCTGTMRDRMTDDRTIEELARRAPTARSPTQSGIAGRRARLQRDALCSRAVRRTAEEHPVEEPDRIREVHPPVQVGIEESLVPRTGR